MKFTSRHRLWGFAAASVLAAAAVALFAPLADWTQALEETLEGVTLLPGLAVFCAVSVLGTLLLVPAWIFPIAAGAVFGFAWGLAAALAAAVLSALAAFLVARFLIPGRIERAARRDECFAAVDRAVKKDPWKVVALLRMSPVLPSALKSYFLGITRVDVVAFTIASALGMFPGLALKVFLGHAGRDALTAGGPLKWTLLAIGLAATLAIAFFVGRAARKRLRLD